MKKDIEARTISKKEIHRTIHKEFAAGREWCRRDWRHYYRLMMDASDAEIWADTFASVETWKEYQSDTVMRLDINPEDFTETIENCEEGFLNNAIKQLLAAGWTIVD